MRASMAFSCETLVEFGRPGDFIAWVTSEEPAKGSSAKSLHVWNFQTGTR